MKIRTMDQAWFTTNATFGKYAAHSELYENTRRFTPVVKKVRGMPSPPLTEEDRRMLREYITKDLEVTADLRKTMLPPQPARPSIIEIAVRFALRVWRHHK